jgi:8-oxo-dGTP pyrophosphatase MutT (NUDIX family)
MQGDRENVQGRIEREEFARGHLPEGAEPVTPRPAATTVLARPGATESFELLMLKRPRASRFAAGAYVFPGGVVDPADGSPYWIDRLPALPNLPDAGRPAATAAIRELFEETGILLSDDDRSEADPGLDEARLALLADERTFEEVAREFSVTFTAAPMTYFARWITPRRLARRYDALFFLVSLPHREHDVSITVEHDAVLWIGPAEALEQFRRGELPMLFPTWKTVEELAGFADLESATAMLGGAPVRAIEPFLDVHGNTVRPRMPEEA